MLCKRVWNAAHKPAFSEIVGDKPHQIRIGLLMAATNVVNEQRPKGLTVQSRDSLELTAEENRMEVECTVANLIYSGLVRGYISHSQGIVVLSKQNPFPDKQ